MKKLLILILMTLMMTGCVKEGDKQKEVEKTEETISLDETFTKGNNIFAWTMFKELNRKDADENIFFSPNSISTAITMTYEGAVGNTAEEIKNALGYSELDKETINKNYTEFLSYLKNMKKVKYNVNNSIWFGEGKIPEIGAEFKNTNKAVFGADIYIEDFGSEKTVSKINKWVSDSTEGKIDEIIDKISPNTAMYLINAVYFKGDWNIPFDAKNTAKENFNNQDGSATEIDMMNIMEEYEFYEDESLKAIKIPYTENEMSMHCILPKEGTIADAVENMTEERWSNIKNTYEKTEVKLKLPKFESAYEKKVLNKSLENLGMVSAFDGELADFSGMGAEGLYIDEVLHSAVIEVNEEGSEAAAVEEIGVGLSDKVAGEDPEFIADKPFIYLIEDEKTGNILFAGVLKDMK